MAAQKLAAARPSRGKLCNSKAAAGIKKNLVKPHPAIMFPHVHPTPTKRSNQRVSFAVQKAKKKKPPLSKQIAEGLYKEQIKLIEESKRNMLRRESGDSKPNKPNTSLLSLLHELTEGEMMKDLKRKAEKHRSHPNNADAINTTKQISNEPPESSFKSKPLGVAWPAEDKQQQQQQSFADLRRDNLSFPSFNLLPMADHPHAYYFDGCSGLPKRNWCLLAEVVEVRSDGYLCLELVDKAGTVFFAVSKLGPEEIPPHKIGVGSTVALLYAAKRYFEKTGRLVTVIERVQDLKIIPLALNDVIRLSDRLHSTILNGKRCCYSCACQPGTEAPLVFCEKCGLFPFCNRDCASRAWKEQGHRRDCQVLQDKEMRMIFEKNWGPSIPNRSWIFASHGTMF